MYSDATIWLIILGLGLGSWCLRFSFLGLLGDRDLPPWALRHLRYTAVAIIPGLIAPMVVFPNGIDAPTDPIRLGIACATLLVGVWTRSIFAGLATGFTLWVLNLVLLD